MYKTNRPKPRYRHKYTKYKKCHGNIMFKYIKQHLSNIWGSIHQKVKQHKGWKKGLKGLHKAFWGTIKKCENKNLS